MDDDAGRHCHPRRWNADRAQPSCRPGIIFENEQVRVWEISLEPGETRYRSRLIERKRVGENSECRGREEPA